MSNILQTLQTTYQQNPAAAISLLPDLFQAVEDGRVIELPCKVGDTVFTTYVSGSGLTREVVAFSFRMENLNDIGKTVFLTREAAAQELKEREKNG